MISVNGAWPRAFASPDFPGVKGYPGSSPGDSSDWQFWCSLWFLQSPQTSHPQALISSGIALHSGQHSPLSQSLFVSPSKDWKTTVGGPVSGDFCVKSNLHTSFGDDSATSVFPKGSRSKHCHFDRFLSVMIYMVVFWGPEVLITCNSPQTWNILDWKLNKEKQNETDNQKGIIGMQISATL